MTYQQKFCSGTTWVIGSAQAWWRKKCTNAHTHMMYTIWKFHEISSKTFFWEIDPSPLGILAKWVFFADMHILCYFQQQYKNFFSDLRPHCWLVRVLAKIKVFFDKSEHFMQFPARKHSWISHPTPWCLGVLAKMSAFCTVHFMSVPAT